MVVLPQVCPVAQAATLVITDKAEMPVSSATSPVAPSSTPPAASPLSTSLQATSLQAVVKREGDVQSGVKPSSHAQRDMSGSVDAGPQKSNSCESGQAGDGVFLNILAGDLVSQKITEWAQKRGYTLSWEAPEFRAGGNLILNKDLDSTLMEFKRAMEMNGVHLDITTYSNCVVRIMEVQ